MISTKSHKIVQCFLFLLLLQLFTGCFSVKYDLKGGVAIDPNIKSFSVQFFDNRASLVDPTLSQTFTEELKDYIANNTSIRLVTNRGDVDFSGHIIKYEITPQAVTGETAAQTRFSIGVQVTYKNNVNDDDSFEKTFTAFRDFESTTSFSNVEDELSEEIREEILEDIFNAAFVNW